MRIRLPSTATVLASVALLVSLSGTAIAAGAVPLAKKALFASNAGKLQGRTATQVASIPGPATTLDGKSAADIAGTAGPASTAAGLVTTAGESFSIPADAMAAKSASCPAGSRLVGGGWRTDGAVFAVDSLPSSDSAWTITLMNVSETAQASGTVYAICLK